MKKELIRTTNWLQKLDWWQWHFCTIFRGWGLEFYKTLFLLVQNLQVIRNKQWNHCRDWHNSKSLCFLFCFFGPSYPPSWALRCGGLPSSLSGSVLAIMFIEWLYLFRKIYYVNIYIFSNVLYCYLSWWLSIKLKTTWMTLGKLL